MSTSMLCTVQIKTQLFKQSIRRLFIKKLDQSQHKWHGSVAEEHRGKGRENEFGCHLAELSSRDAAVEFGGDCNDCWSFKLRESPENAAYDHQLKNTMKTFYLTPLDGHDPCIEDEYQGRINSGCFERSLWMNKVIQRYQRNSKWYAYGQWLRRARRGFGLNQRLIEHWSLWMLKFLRYIPRWYGLSFAKTYKRRRLRKVREGKIVEEHMNANRNEEGECVNPNISKNNKDDKEEEVAEDKHIKSKQHIAKSIVESVWRGKNSAKEESGVKRKAMLTKSRRTS
ncbi:hypothetical protein BY996DRAFT_6576258 [Phakopsora pachyrhizi]|nr:hypothetical protein BY996DRAFT_6576258 [Phakopsora pachyrhizi]